MWSRKIIFSENHMEIVMLTSRLVPRNIWRIMKKMVNISLGNVWKYIGNITGKYDWHMDHLDGVIKIPPWDTTA